MPPISTPRAATPAEPIAAAWDANRGVFIIHDRRFPLTPEQLAVRRRYDEMLYRAPPIVEVQPSWLGRFAERCMRAALALAVRS